MRDTLAYVVQSLPWAAGGMILGFALAIICVRKGLLRGVAMPEKTGPEIPGPREYGDPSTPVEGELVTFELPWWRRSTTWIGAGVALVGVVTLIQGLVFGERTASLQRCQQAYLIGVSDNLRAVREATAGANADLVTVLTTVRELQRTAPPDAQQQFSRALDDYLASRANADRVARENPIRDPRDICQGL